MSDKPSALFDDALGDDADVSSMHAAMAAPRLSDGGSVPLSAQQEQVLQNLFETSSGGSSRLACEEIEGLAARVLQDQVTDEMLDVIIDATETATAFTYAEFRALICRLLHLTTDWGILKTQVDGYVGFDTIGTQINKKMMKRGFEFNLMVVGCAGMGKSTFVDSLFRSKVSRASQSNGYSIPDKTVEVETVAHVIEENGVRLKLSITDTPGFGDQINNTNGWQAVLNYINAQFETYLEAELAVRRQPHIPDSRIHCLLYFIEPSGHGLKDLDIEFLSKLHKVVNIVPVIAKADSMTLDERFAFKNRVREDLSFHGIKTYPGTTTEEEEDAEEAAIYATIRESIPYAVVGANGTASDGTLVRTTKFGPVQVENADHCEFTQLREILIRTCMQDLKDRTAFEQYETFRRSQLEDGAQESAA